jgi:hypothetical protein
MRAVTQYEWTDNGWSPVAVYLFAREMVVGRACAGRPDIVAWVEGVRASARWSPGQNLETLATQMCERFSHQEYGSLYEEVEPAPSLDVLAAREFAVLKTPPPVVEQSEAATSAPGMTWTPGNFDHLTSNEAEAADHPSGLNPEQAGGSALRPVSDPTAGLMCPACGSSYIAGYLYGFPPPDPQLETRIRDGQVVLGGCVIYDDQPDFRCNGCGFEFRAFEIAHAAERQGAVAGKNRMATVLISNPASPGPLQPGRARDLHVG